MFNPFEAADDPYPVRVVANPLGGPLPPAAMPRLRRGVVLLNPSGWEFMRSYRTLRELSARLATAGFDVLRFDYSGTGDSAGTPSDPIELETWMDEVEAAVDRTQGDGRRVGDHLVGLRFGALLIQHLASRLPAGVEQLVFWDLPLAEDRRFDGNGHGTGTASTDLPALRLPAGVQRGISEATAFPIRVRVPALAVTSGGVELARGIFEPEPESLVIEGSPVCWVEESDFGAGAMPVDLLEAIVEWIKP